MNSLVHFIPLVIAASLWFGLYAVNKNRRWLRLGELIFWDAIVLIAVFMIWLKWF